MTPVPHRDGARLALVGGLVTGILIRLGLFLANRPLWTDEASLALNIGTRDAAGLLRPLDFAQGAPPAFLLLTKASTVLFGMNELALRLPALLAGIALLFTVPVIATRLGGPRAGTASAWLVALSPLLLYYSNEVKQYEQEALISAVLILLALPVVRGTATARQRTILTVVGALAVWGALSSVFVLATIGAILALDAFSGEGRHPRPWVLGTLPLWVASIGVAYFTSYRAIARDPHMIAYWRSAFLTANPADLGARLPEVVGGLPSSVFFHRDLFDLLPAALRLAAIGVALLVAAYGLFRVVADHGWRQGFLLLGPIAAVFAAYLLRQYPFTARLLCFAAPCLVLMAASGFATLSMRWPVPLIALASVVALTPATYHAMLDLQDPSRAHLTERHIIDAVEAQRNGEPVYVTATALMPWLYYTTDWERPDVERIRFGAKVYRERPATERGSDTLATMPAVSSTRYTTPPYNELHAAPSGMIAQFDPVGPRSVFPEWGDAEAARIREVARPCAWILARDLARIEAAALSEAIDRAGGRNSGSVPGVSAWATRVCFN